MIMTFDLRWFLSALAAAFAFGFLIGCFLVAWAHAHDARRDKK